MKILKILFSLIFILTIIIVSGLAYLVYAFDANQYKEQIVSVVKKQTGRDLAIAGDLKLSVFPDIAIALGNTSLSNAEGFPDKHFADIGSGEISVQVLPLLKKEIKLAEIRLRDLKLNLHRKADGSTNWDDLSGSEDKPEKQDKKPNEVVQEMLDNLSIAGISLQNAQVHWRDDQGGQDIALSPVNLKTGAFTPGKPLPVELALTMKLKEPAMTVMTEGNTTITISKDKQSFTLSALDFDTQVTGSVVPKGAFHAKIEGDIKGSTSTISVPNLKLQTQLTGDLIPAGKASTTLTGAITFDLNSQQLDVSGLNVVSDVNGQLLEGGNLHALLTSRSTQFNLKSQKLSLKGLDVKADIKEGYLKGGNASAHITSDVNFNLGSQRLKLSNLTVDTTAKGELLQGATAKTTLSAASTQVNLSNTEVKIPKFILNSTVNGGPVPGGKLTQQAQGSVDLNWGKKTGGVTLPTLTVNIADLLLSGSNIKAQPLAEKPSVSGQFQTNTFNLKQVLKTLGIEPPVTAETSALSQVQAKFDLQANTEKAVLNGLQLKLDKSTISGNLAINDFSKQAILAKLKIDRINADNYLPPSTEASSSGGTPSKQASSNAPEAELLPLETLKSLNLDTTLDVGHLIINKLTLSNIHTQVKASNGVIKLNPANASLYKGDYKGNITIDASQAVPTMKMRHELTGLRSEGLLFDLFADKYISGDTKVVTNFSSKGNTISALLKNLNGDTHMSFKDGNIRDSKLADKVSLAVKAFEKKALDGDTSVVTFTGLSGDWKTNNGVFNTNNLLLSSPYFEIKGAGKADVAKQELDMTVRIGKVGNDKVFAPLRVYGSFSDPKFSLDLKGLLKSLAQEDLDKIKQDAKEKLDQAKKDAKEKLEQEKQQLQARLQKEKVAQEKKLREKLDKKKQEAANKLKNKLEDKLGKQATEQIEKQLKGDVEDKVKDKLKEGLRGLF